MTDNISVTRQIARSIAQGKQVATLSDGDQILVHHTTARGKPDVRRLSQDAIATTAGLAAGSVTVAGLTLNIRQFGALGDNSHDDSAAFDSWLTELLALRASGQQVVGYVPYGHYIVGGATSVLTTGILRFKGDDQDESILDFTGSTNEGQIRLNAGFAAKDLQFRAAKDMFRLTDGYAGSFPAEWSSNIDEIRFERVKWYGCRRAFAGVATYTSPTLDMLVVKDCNIDGLGTGWCGFYAGMTNINKSWVTGCDFGNFDGTAAGYNSGSGTPKSHAAGRALRLGGNAPATSLTGGRHIVTHNYFHDVAESREPGGGANPEVQGAQVMGAYSIFCNNRVERINSSGAINGDCEGIYFKCPFGIVSDNVLVDAGRLEASLALKGRTRVQDDDPGTGNQMRGHAIIARNNQITNTRSVDCAGVTIQTDNVLYEGGHIEGFGGDQLYYCPIYLTAQKLHRVKVRNVNIRDIYGRVAVYSRSYGDDNEFSGLDIYNFIGSRATSGTVFYGILVANDLVIAENTGVKGLVIDNNNFSTFAATIAGQAATSNLVTLVSQSASAISYPEVTRNRARTAATIGIRLESGPMDHYTLQNNTWDLCTTPYSTSGTTLTFGRVFNNSGFMFGSVSRNVASLARGAVETFACTVNGYLAGDFIVVAANSEIGNCSTFAEYSSNGTVNISVANLFATDPTDPASRTYRVEARRIQW